VLKFGGHGEPHGGGMLEQGFKKREKNNLLKEKRKREARCGGVCLKSQHLGG
jgi:hypothetical protein